MLDHGPHPPRSREKKRTPWRQHVHRATRPRSYAIDKVWEAVTSRCLGIGNGWSDGRCKQNGGVKSIICYLCFMQHAWSCYFFYHPLIKIIRYTCCVVDLTPPPINLHTQRGWHISEADSCCVIEDFICKLLNPKFRYCFHCGVLYFP